MAKKKKQPKKSNRRNGETPNVTPEITPEQKQQLVDIYRTFRKHFSKKRK